MTRAVLVAAVLLLTGCSAAPATPPVAAAAPVSASRLPAAPTLPTLHLHIPDIDVHQPLEPLARDQDGRLAAPPPTEPMTTGWYEAAPVPGDHGPAIIAGHVSGRPPGADRSVPGVFFLLNRLRPGNLVRVERDAQPLQFEVYRVGTFRKDQFPTADVYSDVDQPELRLITCGGVFDQDAHSYDSNTVVWARLVTNRTWTVTQ